MQVPEKLSLIGGSILLASTLVFTLKSQASNILPKIHDATNEVMQGKSSNQIQDEKQQQEQQRAQQQVEQNFNSDFKRAQQNHWQTGQWGSANFYVDSNNVMHVGSGQLSGSYTNIVDANKISEISLDTPIQAPQDSSYLLGNNFEGSNNTLKIINGLENLDTSQVANMDGMFYEDNSLTSANISHFDTHNVTNMFQMFIDDYKLQNIDVSHFNTSKTTSMYDMFFNDGSLGNIDVSHFNTSNVTNMGGMFIDTDLSNLDLSNWDTSQAYQNRFGEEWMFNGTIISNELTLGPNTRLSDNFEWNGNYKNGNQVLSTSQLTDKAPHPGTWVKQ